MSRRRYDNSSDDEYGDYKKPKTEIDVQETLKKFIYEMGDKHLYELPSDLRTLADVIKRDSSIIKKEILDILVNCAKNIPEKLTIYVTLMGLINCIDIPFGEEIVEALLKHFKEAIKVGNHEDTKFLLRFISDLINTNVIHPGSIMVLYNVLITLALEEETPVLCGDWLVYIVLYSLPWSAAKIAQTHSENLDKLMTNIDYYVFGNKRNLDHLEILQVFSSNDACQPQEDYIICLWEQIKNMRIANWHEKVLWRLYKDPVLEKHLIQSRPHKLPQLALHLSSSVYPVPMVIFRLFDYTDVAAEEVKTTDVKKTENFPGLDSKADIPLVDEHTKEEMDTDQEIKPKIQEELILPGSHSIERFLVEEQYRIIINGFKTNKKICSRLLLNLPLRVKLPISYMIVETILGEMFKLPKPDQHNLYYNSLFIELCREAPDTIPLVLAQATEMLFDKLEIMRPICIERMVNWFSHHLSNFKYQWSWADWSDSAKESTNKPKTRFIVEVLERILRLSFFDYLKSIVPADFARLLPKPPGSVNKYGQGAPRNLRCQKTAIQLTGMFKSQAKCGEIINFLQSISDSREDLEETIIESDEEGEDESKIDEEDKKLPTKEEPKLVDENTEKDVDEDAKMIIENKVESKIPVQNVELYPGVTRRVIDVLVTSLLNVSNKTFTHSFIFLEKYKNVLKEFITDSRDEVEVLHSLFGVWQEQQQYMVVLSQRMIELEIISPRAVICWLFSDELFNNLTQFYLFEIVNILLEHSSHEENTAWLTLQDIEESCDRTEMDKTAAKKEYARTRKNYMDLVKQVLAGVICRLNEFSTSAAKTNKYHLNLVELLQDLTNQAKPEEEEEDSTTVNAKRILPINDEMKFWLLGRIEGLMLSVELPYNYLLKSFDEFFKSIKAPDQVLEIYGVFRNTIKQN